MRLAADSPAGFAAIYREHYPQVLAYFRRRTFSTDAEELTSETFVRAWHNIRSLREPSRPLPWLYGIARNVLLESYRGHTREAVQARSAEEYLEQVATRGFAEAVDLTLDVNQALLRLSETEREALILSAWEGLSPSEVAEALGISGNLARVRIHRARRLLSHILDVHDRGALRPVKEA